MNEFDKWNELKKDINNKEKVLNFKEREIFFIYLGKNIGFEQDGKGKEFLRPVLILKKFNSRFFLGILLTKQNKNNKYYFKLTENSFAILSQVKVFDAKRLKYFSKRLNGNIFNEIIKVLKENLLPNRESGLTSNYSKNIISQNSKKNNNFVWIDIATPKYAHFFARLIPYLENVLVTARYSKDYIEVKEILDSYNLKYHLIGNYGGKNKKDKFLARLKRQEEFLNLFEKTEYPKLLINGAVVDSSQFAYGIGIPIITFYDTPIVLKPNYNKIHYNLTPVSKLTLPFADIVYYPFVIPKEIFEKNNINTKSYNFIDVCLWMKDIKKNEKKDFRKKYNIPLNKPTILIREEEYKAHYVKEKKPFVYKLIKKLKNENFNIVIIPRYESEYLKKEFPFTYIIEDKLKPEEFYPFIDFFVGAGGTMTLEAVYMGIPTISMRSIWLIHDKYLIDNNLMLWTNDVNKAYEYIKANIGKKFDNKKFFCKSECSLENIAKEIKEFYENSKFTN